MTRMQAGATTTVLGGIELQPDALIFYTNSVERGKAGANLINSLLSDSVGPTMGVH